MIQYGPETPLWDIIARQRHFSSTRFGYSQDISGIIEHIREELVEIEDAPDDLEERVDNFILAMELLWKSGRRLGDILAMISYKQTKNENREWPSKDEIVSGKPIKHIKR